MRHRPTPGVSRLAALAGAAAGVHALAMMELGGPVSQRDAVTAPAGRGVDLWSRAGIPASGCNCAPPGAELRWRGARLQPVTAPLLEICEVSKSYSTRGGSGAAVAAVSLSLDPGDSGWVKLDGRRLDSLSRAEFRRARTVMQPVFQDAAAALNPRRTVGGHMLQALGGRDAQALQRAIQLLDGVGLRPGEAFLARLPHELSGGQRQRLTIARALAPQPRLLIADEPLSGADVSIRGQILNLLLDIKSSRGVATLLIVHDIALARAFADRVAVMFKGAIVEAGPTEQVLGRPQHPIRAACSPRFLPCPPARRPERRA
jgi:ABC-type dipeptide/oligopeptide/nickel transport system ATPase subunit